MSLDAALISIMMPRSLVWDVTGLIKGDAEASTAPIPASQVPTPTELERHAEQGTLGVIAAPSIRDILPVLALLGLLPENLEYVIGFDKRPSSDFTDLIAEIPEDILLVGFDGTSASGRYADLFTFTDVENKRPATFIGEVPDDVKSIMRLNDADVCLSSITRWIPQAFGKAKLEVSSYADKIAFSDVFSKGADIEFLPVDFPAWKGAGMGSLDNVTNPALADDINSISKAKEALFERRSRIPELMKYREIWLYAFDSERARLNDEGVRAEGKMTAGEALAALPELVERYGLDYMMDAVDEGVPVEYVVSQAKGEPTPTDPRQQAAFDRLAKHLSK